MVRLNDRIKGLMEQFVRVRLIQCNSLDLSLFQFDYDLTLAMFFMNADRTIYGRYGTRSSQKEATRDISMDGLAKALEGALELHQDYPSNQAALAGKTGPPARVRIPQDYPALSGKYTPFLDYQGKVAASCIHCHQVRDAQRKAVRQSGQAMADDLLYPWPMPDVLGLSLDPTEKATVVGVRADSSAQADGFEVGDEIVSLAEQPMLSIADVQWVIHASPESSQIAAKVRRGDGFVDLKLTLEKGWRRASDIAWRTTSWDLRRIASGGLLLHELTDAERTRAGVSKDDLGLRVEHVGQYGGHAVAKKAGFLKNDIIIEFDGHSEYLRETDLFAHVMRNRMVGYVVPVTVLRDGKKMNFEIRLQ